MRSKIVVGSVALAIGSLTKAQAPNHGLMALQSDGISKLAFLDGEWVGPAQSQERNGVIRMTQIERSGSLLGGTVRLVEGRSYDDSGRTLFNALAVISFDPQGRKHLITSHASGYATTTELNVRSDGFDWEVPAGPGVKMRFHAMVKGGSWSETGDLILPDGKSRRTFDMTVNRCAQAHGHPVLECSIGGKGSASRDVPFDLVSQFRPELKVTTFRQLRMQAALVAWRMGIEGA